MYCIVYNTHTQILPNWKKEDKQKQHVNNTESKKKTRHIENSGENSFYFSSIEGCFVTKTECFDIRLERERKKEKQNETQQVSFMLELQT